MCLWKFYKKSGVAMIKDNIFRIRKRFQTDYVLLAKNSVKKWK